MRTDELYAFIQGAAWKGSCLGLGRMEELMHRLGDPQNRLKYIHVAGTNGKGSVSTLLAGILGAAGYKVGLYTSPHLCPLRRGRPGSGRRRGHGRGLPHRV